MMASDSMTSLNRKVVGSKTRSVASTLVAPDSDRKSTRLNSSHGYISYAVFCLKKKKYQAARRVAVGLPGIRKIRYAVLIHSTQPHRSVVQSHYDQRYAHSLGVLSAVVALCFESSIMVAHSGCCTHSHSGWMNLQCVAVCCEYATTNITPKHKITGSLIITLLTEQSVFEVFFFFFNTPPPPEISLFPLPAALPI